MATQDGKDGNEEGQPPPAGKGGTQPSENSTGFIGSPVLPPTPLSSLSDTEPENTKTEPVKDTRKKGTARNRRERLKRKEA